MGDKMYHNNKEAVLAALNEAAVMAENLTARVVAWGEVLEARHQLKTKEQNETGIQNTISNEHR
jgi:hypothetical protein